MGLSCPGGIFHVISVPVFVYTGALKQISRIAKRPRAPGVGLPCEYNTACTGISGNLVSSGLFGEARYHFGSVETLDSSTHERTAFMKHLNIVVVAVIIVLISAAQGQIIGGS